MAHELDHNTIAISANIDWRVTEYDNGDREGSADLTDWKGVPVGLASAIQNWLDSSAGELWILDQASAAGALAGR